MVEPVLKWAGGKRQIMEAILECFPPESSCGRYHEPFFGGGALFFDTGPHSIGSSINDINKRLMNFYRVVRDKPDELIRILQNFRPPEAAPNPNREFADQNRKGKKVDEYYYQQRELFNRRPNEENFDPIEEAALLLYLNRTCYNGLYRENSSGEFNVPIGSYSNPNWIQANRIEEAHEFLQNTDILNQDFSYILNRATKDDLVYFDPPYEPISRTSSFVEYHTGSFESENQTRLRDVAVELDKMGVYVVISNSPEIETKYEHLDEFVVHEVGAKRQINSNADDRDEVQEILVTNVPEDNRRLETKNLDSWMEASD